MKVWVFSAIAITILILSFALLNKPKTPQISVSTPVPSPVIQDEKVDIKASFFIKTGSITRSFKTEKYHNKSPDVYIESSNPTIVHVTKAGITWNDFFKTLPMKLTKECLTTGDGETFCDGQNLPAGRTDRQGGTLKFFLNDIEDKNLLDKEIEEGNSILIQFTSY